MPRIDAYVDALRRIDAERLVIASGKPPTLSVGGVQRTIPGEVLDRDAVHSLITEIAPPDHAAAEEQVGCHRFAYDSPHGRFEITTRRTEGLVHVIAVPATDEAEPVATASIEAGSVEAGPALHAVERETVARPPEAAPDATPTPVEVAADPSAADWVLSDSTAMDPVATDPVARDPMPRPPSVEAPPAAEAPPLAPEPPAPRPADQSPVLEMRDDAPALERLFLKMVENGCSDLHVSAGNVPLFRKDGQIADLGGEPQLSPTQAEALLFGITPDRYRKQFEERNDTDFAYEIAGVARFRGNLFRDRKGVGGVFRQIPAEIITAQQLGLSNRLLELCQLKKGLILVTGPTGSGKSTTLAALIDYINGMRTDHIITIEDPIEFVHQNKKCLINQREVGEHTAGFKVALRAALREDPDIVLVGELRDLETVEIALETAETGHLVFGTLHTNTAPGTVSRIIDQFPAGQQAQIRTMLADTLVAVVAQTLCRKKTGGRVAAMEILIVTNAVANLIREDKTFQIPSAMQTGRSVGMQTLGDALMELVKQGVITPMEAYRHAVDKTEFAGILKRNGIELDPARLGPADVG